MSILTKNSFFSFSLVLKWMKILAKMLTSMDSSKNLIIRNANIDKILHSIIDYILKYVSYITVAHSRVFRLTETETENSVNRCFCQNRN